MTAVAELDEAGWAADIVFGEEPSPAPVAIVDPCDAEAVTIAGPTAESAAVDLDETGLDATPPDELADVNAGAKRAALVLGAGLAVAVAVVAGMLLSFRQPTETPRPNMPAPAGALAAGVPSVSPARLDQDQAVAFTASADCPAGSTSAQAITDPTSDSAWVCVRGAVGAAVDGQVLRLDLGRSYVLSAISVSPGWVAKTPGGRDEWLQHRVVSRLQYVFNDDDRTVITQDTGNAHGPVTMPLPHKILASRVTVIVLQTARPPASPPPDAGSAAEPQPGFLDSVLGEGGAPVGPDVTQTEVPGVVAEPDDDPVDATFAISALLLFGHLPN
jgi:hypothetical protein